MKRFDSDYPFRLVIAITKGDLKGKTLSTMAQGTGVAYKDTKEADVVACKFVEMANHIDGEFSSYGLIILINEETKTVHQHYTL